MYLYSVAILFISAMTLARGSNALPLEYRVDEEGHPIPPSITPSGNSLHLLSSLNNRAESNSTRSHVVADLQRILPFLSFDRSKRQSDVLQVPADSISDNPNSRMGSGDLHGFLPWLQGFVPVVGGVSTNKPKRDTPINLPGSQGVRFPSLENNDRYVTILQDFAGAKGRKQDLTLSQLVQSANAAAATSVVIF